MSNESAVALFRGPWTAVWTFANRDAVYEYFGPFDIGPCLDVVVWGCEFDVGFDVAFLHAVNDFLSGVD